MCTEKRTLMRKLGGSSRVREFESSREEFESSRDEPILVLECTCDRDSLTGLRVQRFLEEALRT
jgi:hypothetical protein